jgi:hypothetical protein
VLMMNSRSRAERHIAISQSSDMHDSAQIPMKPSQSYPAATIVALIESLFSTFDTPGISGTLSLPVRPNPGCLWRRWRRSWGMRICEAL